MTIVVLLMAAACLMAIVEAGVVFRQGGAAIDYIPGQDVGAGAVVVENTLVGVTKVPIASGRLGALHIAGVFAFPKAVGSDTDIDRGTVLYWDETDEQVTEDDEAGANAKLGISVKAATDDDVTVDVLVER